MALEHEVKLENLGNGAADELFNLEIKEVTRNILDPNTKPTAKRSVTLTVTFVPNEDRTSCMTRIEVCSKQAPIKAHTTVVYPAMDGDEPVMMERNPKQPSLFGQVEPAAPPKLVKPEKAAGE